MSAANAKPGSRTHARPVRGSRSRRRRRLTALAVAVAVLVIGAGVWRWNAGTAKLDMAPPFTLLASDGRTISLADFRGRPVVLIFYMVAT